MWTGIDALYCFQDLRMDFPFLEDLFGVFSSKLFYIVLPLMVALFFYWLYDRRKGEVLALGFISAMSFAMVSKGIIHQPRPWELDPGIECVPGANPNGYSCPSGHTTAMVSAIIPSAVMVRRKLLSILLLIIAVMVVIGRLVMCAHTPLDIIVGIAVGAVGIVIAWKAVDLSERSERNDMIVAIVYAMFFTIIFAASFVTVDDNSDVFQYMGFVYGLIAARYLEHRYIGFEPMPMRREGMLVVYVFGMLVCGILLLLILLFGPAGGLVGGSLMMLWAFLFYPKLLSDGRLFSRFRSEP